MKVKMRINTGLTRLVLSLLLASPSAPAAADIIPIPGSQRIKPAFDSSDLVCSGTVASVIVETDSSSQALTPGWVNQRATATIEIEDIYKETRATERKVVVVTAADVPLNSSKFSIFRTRDKFLLFLKTSVSGGYNLADPFLGATHFNFLPQQGGEPGLEKLQNLLTAILIGQDQEDVSTSLRLLEGFESISDKNLATVGKLRFASKPDIALGAIDVSLTARNSESLRNLAAYLGQYKGNAEPFALSNIGNRLADFRDEQSFPWIKEFTRSRFLPVRLGAMRSLRARRNPESVPQLVDRLDDSNDTIRYLAVITLAEVLGKYDGDYAPSMFLFDKNPQYYINLWKQWWVDEGARLYPREEPRT